MKYLIIATLSIFTCFTRSSAQVLDTISMGSNYAFQNWYKIETDKEVKASATNWDLAFTTGKQDASIWTNHGSKLYKAVAPASAWATLNVDTTSLSEANLQVNTDTSWAVGAFNRTADNYFDYGWGNYVFASHNVIGDSIYVFKAATDGKWRKIFIEKLAYDTSFFVRVADLDGANQRTFEVKKAAFAGRNFGYYSFLTASTLNREPLSKDWDLSVFRYWSVAADPNTGILSPYLVAGVLQNKGITVAKAVRRDTASDLYTTLPFKTIINTIGADWKTYDITTNRYKMADSTAYFVKTGNGKVFKMVFRGFGGAADGNCIFTRELMTTTTPIEISLNKTAVLAVSPNPAIDGQINIVYDLGKTSQQADFQLISLSGQVIFTQKLNNTEGVQNIQLPFLYLTNGLYIAKINFDNHVMIQKVMVQ